MTFSHRLRSLNEIKYRKLRTGTHVMRASAASVGVKIFGDAHVRVNAAGGDLPKSLGVTGLQPIVEAAEGVSDNGGYEYSSPSQERARLALAEYFGLSPSRIFFAGGLSSFSRELFEKHRLINGKDAVAIHACASHPLFWQDTHFNLGRFAVLEVNRTPDGKIDLGSLKERIRELEGRKVIVSLVPWENPTGIIYPESFFTGQDGLFEQLAPIRENVWLYLDCMYHDFGYIESMSVKKLVEMANRYGFVGAIGVGLSKIMLGPGLRGAGIGIFGDSEEIDALHDYLVRWETSTINSGVSNNTFAALEAAFSGREDVQRAIAELRGRVKDRGFPNRSTLLQADGIHPAYLAGLECAFYQLLRIEGTRWSDPNYTAQQWRRIRDKISEKLGERRRQYADKGWDPRDAGRRDLQLFLTSRETLSDLLGYPETRLTPDESFVMDLIEHHGVALAPGSLFFSWDSHRFPLGPGGERHPIVRTVLSHDPSVYPQIVEAIQSLLRQG